MIVYYRISDGSYKKNRFPFTNKEVCLNNFMNNFSPSEIRVIADNVSDETMKMIQHYIDYDSIEKTSFGNGAASWRYAAQLALGLEDTESILFQEDDYLYLENSQEVLDEGLEVSDYCSLYDHRDKYIEPELGGNPFVENGGEVTRVIKTKSTHWKLSNSTTMTFATKVKTLREDWDIWDKYTLTTHPNDFAAFLELRDKGRSLITPIPTYSTHCEVEWAAPFINWQDLVNYDQSKVQSGSHP